MQIYREAANDHQIIVRLLARI